jgi:hypothetical protein
MGGISSKRNFLNNTFPSKHRELKEDRLDKSLKPVRRFPKIAKSQNVERFSFFF